MKYMNSLQNSIHAQNTHYKFITDRNMMKDTVVGRKILKEMELFSKV